MGEYLASHLITPLQIVFYRVLFGFLPVLVYARLKGRLRFRHLRYLPHFLIMSFLATTIYYYGFARGTSLLPSGIAGALSGSIPLFSFLLAALLLPQEKVTGMKLAGVLIGFAGVAAIARPSGQQLITSNLEGVFFMVIGSLSVGASFVYARKFIAPLKIPAAALTTYQLGAALIVLSFINDYGGMAGIWSDLHASLGLVVGLGLLGTGGAYILYYYIVQRFGAIGSSSVTYIPPVVALIIGAFLVGEPIQMLDYLAAALIVAGVVLLRK